MKSAKTIEGVKRFSQDQYLTPRQIKGLFSRYASDLKKRKLNDEIVVSNDNDGVNEDIMIDNNLLSYMNFDLLPVS